MYDAPRPIHTAPGQCPVCGEQLHITRLQCNDCDTTIEGHFMLDRFARLSGDQMGFLETFIKNRGVIKDIEVDLGISYPTVKTRIDDVVRSLGFSNSESSLRPSQVREERRSILEELHAGKINADKAARRMAALGDRRS